ncbi:MAG: hypothetical protein ACXIUL_11005 [Wenzhouxiangella sp.]
MHSDPDAVKATRLPGPPPNRLPLTVVWLNLLLMLPLWWQAASIGSAWLVAEAWLIPGLLALAAGRPGLAWLRWPAALWLCLLVVVLCGDALVRQVLSRPLNLALDPLLLRAGFHLIEGAAGFSVAVLSALLLAGGLLGLLAWLARRLHPDRLAAEPGLIAPVLVVGLVLSLFGPWLPAGERISPALVQAQHAQIHQTLQGQTNLLARLGREELAAQPLPGLADRNVYLVFVESYGISALDQPRYGQRLKALLDTHEHRLDAVGFASVSGWLEAPIRGGQSWLAHATSLSGLRIDNDHWYRLLLDRSPDTLADDFRATGHLPMVVSPAIIFDWPEAEQLGFEAIITASEMGYEGPPLGWVTMPDQFTLDAVSRRLVPDQASAVFAMIALISSHAPWIPVIEPIDDWDTIGSGQVFDRWADQNESPLRLWFNPARLRQAYLDSLDYSLSVTFDWVLQHPDPDALIIVMGDHQAASIITGRDASAAVPVHVISGDSALLTPFIERGWQPGLRPDLTPDGTAEITDMAELRHWLRDDFGQSAEAKKARPETGRARERKP